MDKNIPQNCRECSHGAECKGPYYGGSYCKFQKEIYEQHTAKIMKCVK